MVQSNKLAVEDLDLKVKEGAPVLTNLATNAILRGYVESRPAEDPLV